MHWYESNKILLNDSLEAMPIFYNIKIINYLRLKTTTQEHTEIRTLARRDRRMLRHVSQAAELYVVKGDLCSMKTTQKRAVLHNIDSWHLMEMYKPVDKRENNSPVDKRENSPEYKRENSPVDKGGTVL